MDYSDDTQSDEDATDIRGKKSSLKKTNYNWDEKSKHSDSGSKMKAVNSSSKEGMTDSDYERSYKGSEFKKSQNELDNEFYYYEEESMHQSFHEHEQEKIEDRNDSSDESISSVYSKLSPFTIKWSFGIKTSVELINLTTETDPEVFFVSSHFGIVYNFLENKMVFLPGHNFPIRSISADASGHWLVTADMGEDNVIIIWDNKRKLPAWSLYNVFPNGVKYVKISHDAKFLAALNSEFNFALKFWQWTHGYSQPDGEIEIDPTYGAANHIEFNHKNTKQFVLTMKFRITLCEWMNDLKKIETFTPNFESRKKKWGVLRQSIFLDDNHTAVTSTNIGYLLVWCDIDFTKKILENTHGKIEKKFIKAVRIHKAGISSLKLCDKMLVTGAENGIIYFHDQLFHLMYILPKFNLDPIASLSFNISDYNVDIFDERKKSSSARENALEMENQSLDISKLDISLKEKLKNNAEDAIDSNPINFDLSKIVKPLKFEEKVKRVPSDCTLDRHPFLIRDLVFLTTTGKIGYLSHQRRKIKYYFYRAEAPVLAMACSPNKNHLIVSYSSGLLILYNYITKKIMVSDTIPGVKLTAFQYSHLGHTLMGGTESGTIVDLDPLLLVVRNTLLCGKAPIEKICLSLKDDLLACYDKNSTVYLFSKVHTLGKKRWIAMGRYISHYKPICDILFEKPSETSKRPRLFTIGEDRMLVEYDTVNLEINKLKILQIHRIEQTAIPRCFIWHPNFYKTNDFLIANSEYKLKLVDSNTQICKKTTLGPTADSPIQSMVILPQEGEQIKKAKMIYATEKHIGLKILPSTGNPFESMGMIAHPVKIVRKAISHDCKYVFTAGEKDCSILMWETNSDSVDIACQIGGSGLEPFVSLIEGGPNSFFFKEIEDFFYYAQIIHQGEDPNLDRSVSKSLALCEIPDLFRALGYYPTDYEVNNLIYELKHLNHSETGEIVSEVSFEECVKAFLNHKPVHSISLTYINNALVTIADLSDPTDILVERSELYKALEEKGEAMDHKEVLGYLCILLLPKDETNPIPPTLSLNDFTVNVLGIDLNISEGQVRQITHSFENTQYSPNAEKAEV